MSKFWESIMAFLGRVLTVVLEQFLGWWLRKREEAKLDKVAAGYVKSKNTNLQEITHELLNTSQALQVLPLATQGREERVKALLVVGFTGAGYLLDPDYRQLPAVIPADRGKKLFGEYERQGLINYATFRDYKYKRNENVAIEKHIWGLDQTEPLKMGLTREKAQALLLEMSYNKKGRLSIKTRQQLKITSKAFKTKKSA